jgi:hypothetical protein
MFTTIVCYRQILYLDSEKLEFYEHRSQRVFDRLFLAMGSEKPQ